MRDYEISLKASLNDDEEKPDKSSKPVLGSDQTEAETFQEGSVTEPAEPALGSDQTEAETFQEGSVTEPAEERPQESLPEESPQAEAEHFVAEEPVQAETVPLTTEEEPEQEYRRKDGSSIVGSAVKGMISFFTIIPVNADKGDIDAMNKNFWLTPALMGVLYGLLAAISFYILQWFFGFSLGIVLTMALLIVMNRMLHLDGLMDTADGLTVAGTREDHLRALKDTNVGAGGFVTAIVVIIATLFAYMSFNLWGALVVLFVGEVIAKTTQVAAAAYGEPGNGMAGDSVRSTSKDKFILSYLMSVVVSVIWTVLVLVVFNSINDLTWFRSDTYFVVAAGLAAATAPLLGVLMANMANKNFGYVNGDVLGASNEMGRLAVLMMFVLFLNLLFRI